MAEQIESVSGFLWPIIYTGLVISFSILNPFYIHTFSCPYFTIATTLYTSGIPVFFTVHSVHSKTLRDAAFFPRLSVSGGHCSALCGLHDFIFLSPIISLRFAETFFRYPLDFLSILSCFFFSFFSILCVFTLSSQFVHNLFIIHCYTIIKLREQLLNGWKCFHYTYR